MTEHNVFKRTIVKENIASEALGQTRNVRIYLPPGYDEHSQYPVVYCQDGEEFFNFGRIATQANRMILEEGVRPFVIAGIDTDMPNRTAQYAPEGAQFEAYSRFFTEELLPVIERGYAVAASASGRVLAGDSLGGTVSLHLALDYPHLFDKVLSLSGAFLEETAGRVEAENDLSGLTAYMLIGTHETAVGTARGTFDFLAGNRRLHRLLVDRRARLRYVEKPGQHVWGFWQQELPEALLYCLEAVE